jgi:hypothetical protein
MRPFGHDGAREERDARIVPLDDRLQKAWAQYRADAIHPITSNGEFLRAIGILEPIRPSCAQLHAFILRASFEKWWMRSALGCFISAGYQLLPEKEIIYDLDTPDLNLLGFFLSDKRLIIDGRVNEHAGNHMIGELVINGVAGPYAGYKMIGTLAVHGRAENHFGAQMIGEYLGSFVQMPSMIGRMNGIWSRGDALWMPEAPTRERFCDDIDNPSHASHSLLYEHLTKTYGRNA